jgi:hypothetical protein
MEETMKHLLRIMMFVGAVIVWGGADLMAVEEATYASVLKDGKFEIRDYAPCIVAEVEVGGTFKKAGNAAFRSLFRYISGDNRLQQKIDMTAPVSQEARSAKIAMTAPVGQHQGADGWVVSFVMPATYTMATIPVPTDPNVSLRQIPARRLAAVRYSGFWSEKKYLLYKSKLELWLKEKGLISVGDPIWARYNPPIMPWFLRRNEILIPINQP